MINNFPTLPAMSTAVTGSLAASGRRGARKFAIVAGALSLLFIVRKFLNARSSSPKKKESAVGLALLLKTTTNVLAVHRRLRKSSNKDTAASPLSTTSQSTEMSSERASPPPLSPPRTPVADTESYPILPASPVEDAQPTTRPPIDEEAGKAKMKEFLVRREKLQARSTHVAVDSAACRSTFSGGPVPVFPTAEERAPSSTDPTLVAAAGKLKHHVQTAPDLTDDRFSGISLLKDELGLPDEVYAQWQSSPSLSRDKQFLYASLEIRDRHGMNKAFGVHFPKTMIDAPSDALIPGTGVSSATFIERLSEATGGKIVGITIFDGQEHKDDGPLTVTTFVPNTPEEDAAEKLMLEKSIKEWRDRDPSTRGPMPTYKGLGGKHVTETVLQENIHSAHPEFRVDGDEEDMVVSNTIVRAELPDGSVVSFMTAIPYTSMQETE